MNVIQIVCIFLINFRIKHSAKGIHRLRDMNITIIWKKKDRTRETGMNQAGVAKENHRRL